jgi:hypothetical protein
VAEPGQLNPADDRRRLIGGEDAVNSDHIRALRHVRGLVGDMRWRGLTVPPLYDRMAGEFQDLVDSGDYANWVATGTAAAPPDRAGSLPSGTGELVRPGR